MVKAPTGQLESRGPDRSGFALMAVLVTVAVIAILAGILGPMAFRQMMQAREQETLQEMETLQEALLAFLNDTGRLPTDHEGLTALINDPGVAGWQGPYVTGDRYIPSEEVTTDAFGQPYLYDLAPITDPPGDTDLLLASGGMNRTVSTGSVDDSWSLDGDEDDLLRLINTGPAQRSMTTQALAEMQAIGEAAQQYFEHHTAFPATTDALSSIYLDPDFANHATIDPWLQDYTLTGLAGTSPPALTISSLGPNRTDDGGGADDLTLVVSSVGPGRKATRHLIAIAQAAMDAHPATDLTGDWSSILLDLGLTSAFVADGWGHPYELSESTRTVVSSGPDGDFSTPLDNIPTGVTPDVVVPGL